jgi:hypothetical protein
MNDDEGVLNEAAVEDELSTAEPEVSTADGEGALNAVDAEDESDVAKLEV